MPSEKEINIYKIEHSIYFANCTMFAKNIYKLNRLEPSKRVLNSVLHKQSPNRNLNHACINGTKLSLASETSEATVDESRPNLTTVDMLVDLNHNDDFKRGDFILDFSAVNYVDTNGIQVIEELIDDFKHLGVFIYICQPQESFIKMIINLKLVEKFDDHIFLTIDDAIKHFNNK